MTILEAFRTLPRDLHPAAWWIWALGLAAAASRTTNPWLLSLVIGVVVLTVLVKRSDAPWALSFRLYVALGVMVVVLRVVFRVVFGGGLGSTVLVDLPSVPLPDWAAGITLLGPVTLESIVSGFYDGLRLATVILCVGAANTLANPRRLLAGLPPALYEVGTAVVIALSLFPQLAESVQRVRQARRLRGDPGRGIGALRRIVVPVLEDALERSLSLAASMDARGYGRAGDLSRRQRWTTGALLIGGLVGLCVGTYAFLDTTAPRALATPMLVVGLVLAGAGFLVSGRRVHRTRYRPDRWLAPDVAIAVSGLGAAAGMTWVAASRLDVVLPDPALAPPLTLVAMASVMLGLAPVVLAPAPLMQSARTGGVPPREEVAP